MGSPKGLITYTASKCVCAPTLMGSYLLLYIQHPPWLPSLSLLHNCNLCLLICMPLGAIVCVSQQCWILIWSNVVVDLDLLFDIVVLVHQANVEMHVRCTVKLQLYCVINYDRRELLVLTLLFMLDEMKYTRGRSCKENIWWYQWQARFEPWILDF